VGNVRPVQATVPRCRIVRGREMGNDMKRVGERMDEIAALAIAHSKNPSSSAGRGVKTFSLDQLSGLIDKLAMDSPALNK
jgi:hypothetical protein